MALVSKINVPLTSISDIKKAPMKAFSISKENHTAVYVLNNNKEVGVIIDIDEYNKMIEFIESSYALIDDFNEQKYQEKIKLRLDQDDGHRYTNEEVIGKDWQQEIEQIPDEWE